ncbi:hypothetical protein [Bordetella sp. 15P40C-2]|uniref:hypothetical protein n=1 Tax=Bordetella sp. 15P40C-2 TaxID=2572246 RepID=UPI0013244426|nr:hypothetical protein [Bordetella sp. 15P40C-2]MVW72120.1 hypothetical protein [Bordetella sp. 15P40C-2]
MNALLAEIMPYLAGLAALAVAFVGVFFRGKSSGKDEARVEQLEADTSAREEAREAAAEIERLDDAAVRDRARERMRRNQGR